METPWDHGLARTMLEHLTTVEEEAVLDHLLADLMAGRQPPYAR
jgi:hypothetical protein